MSRQYGVEWLTGPNKGYGFSPSGYDGIAISLEEQTDMCELFLSKINPETGYRMTTRVSEIDERIIGREHTGADFVVFVYEGSDAPGQSWSVASYLLAGASLPEVAAWLRQTLPPSACYSVGVVLGGSETAASADLHVAWILGADVLNTGPRSGTEQRTADEMLARRARVDW